MIPSSVRAFVAIEPINLRFSFNRLAGRVKEQIGHEPRSGALFVFSGNVATRSRLFSSTARAFVYVAR